MGEGIHDVYLGFKDVDDNKQQAVRISKKVLGKYEEPLNFAVGTTTSRL
jgi:hemolysin